MAMGGVGTLVRKGIAGAMGEKVTRFKTTTAGGHGGTMWLQVELEAEEGNNNQRVKLGVPYMESKKSCTSGKIDPSTMWEEVGEMARERSRETTTIWMGDMNAHTGNEGEGPVSKVSGKWNYTEAAPPRAQDANVHGEPRKPDGRGRKLLEQLGIASMRIVRGRDRAGREAVSEHTYESKTGAGEGIRAAVDYMTVNAEILGEAVKAGATAEGARMSDHRLLHLGIWKCQLGNT